MNKLLRFQWLLVFALMLGIGILNVCQVTYAADDDPAVNLTDADASEASALAAPLLLENPAPGQVEGVMPADDLGAEMAGLNSDAGLLPENLGESSVDLGSEAPSPELPSPDVSPAAIENENALLDFGLLLPTSQASEQEDQLNEAFVAGEAPQGVPSAAEGEGLAQGAEGQGINPQQALGLRMAALGQSVQEAALLSAGGPLAEGGEDLGDLPANDMMSGMQAVRAIMSDFGEIMSQEYGMPPGQLQNFQPNFEKIQENFNVLAERMESLMGGAFERPQLGGGEEGNMGPLPLFQDFGTMMACALSGVNPDDFAKGMEQVFETRQQFFEMPNFDEGEGPQHFAVHDVPGGNFGPMDPGLFTGFASAIGPAATGFGPMFTPEGPLPFGGPVPFGGPLPAGGESFFGPGQGFEGNFGNLTGQVPLDDFREIALAITQAVTHDRILVDVVQQFNATLQTLPPEALIVLHALNENFTAADLVFLQNNPGQNIARAFSHEITGNFTNTVGQRVDFPGQEHLHVTYSLNTTPPVGDVPITHVDANLTAVHSEDHTQSAQLPAEAAHIPGIQA